MKSPFSVEIPNFRDLRILSASLSFVFTPGDDREPVAVESPVLVAR